MRLGAIFSAVVLVAACGGSSSEASHGRAAVGAGGREGTAGSSAPAAGESGSPDAGAGTPGAAGEALAGKGGSHAAGRGGGGGKAPRAGAGGTGGKHAQGTGGSGAAGEAGEFGASGAPDAGTGGAAGDPSVGSAGAGPDPCEGATAWDPQASWTSYATNEQRTFGGVLWRCATDWGCGTYPGSPDAPGWVKVTDCAGGPTGEVAPCQCTTGQCCDGCYFRSYSYFLEYLHANCISNAGECVDFWTTSFCNGDSPTDARVYCPFDGNPEWPPGPC